MKLKQWQQPESFVSRNTLDIGTTSLRDAHLGIWILMKKTALAHQGQNINGFLSDLEKQNPLSTHK